MTEAGASVSVTVEGNAAPFLSALKPPPGWAMDEPHLSSVDALTRLTLHLSPPTASGSAP